MRLVFQYAIVLITIKDLKQDTPPQTHFLVCMQITLGLSRELAPCPLPGSIGATNP